MTELSDKNDGKFAANYREAVNRIITVGIEAATRDYAMPHQKDKREGSIAGFNACRDKELDQFIGLLTEANKAAQEHYGQKDYWYWRCRAAEIEWVCNVLSNVPVLATVSKRIWYHATDDQASYPFSAVILAALKNAAPQAPMSVGNAHPSPSPVDAVATPK